MRIRTAILLAGCLVTFAAAWAQGTTSRLLGVVQDSTGAVVAGAAVELTSEATNAKFQTKSSDSGTYLFDAIQPGLYTVTVSAAGFHKISARQNQVSIGQPTTVNIRLEVGAVTEVIEVSGAYETVQTSTSGNFGNLLAQQTIADMPIVGLRGRNPVNLVFLQPGVVSGANTGGGSHVNGARDRAWNYTLDGVDVNETSSGGSETTPTKMNPDSLAEFRVITSNFTADSGRNSGAQVAMVTRSGSNEFHGSAFWFYRTPRLNANEWENNVLNVGKRMLVQNIFGGSVGGPVWKNKTFFFVNYQDLHALETSNITRTVYTDSARRGLWRYVRGGRNSPAGTANASVDAGGNVLPGVNIGTYNIVASDPARLGIDKRIAELIGQTPMPNRFDFGDGLNTAGYTFNPARKDDNYDVTMKFDHIINSKNMVYARIYFGKQTTLCDSTNGGQELFPGLTCLVNTAREPNNLAFNWRYNPTPSITNEFVFGRNYFKYNFDQPNRSLTTYTLDSAPVTVPADTSYGNLRTLRTWQFVDNATWTRGAHAVKFGANFRIQTHWDNRGSVAGLNAAPVLNFSTSINPVDPASFGLPADINQSFDRGPLESNINFLLGKVGRLQQGFVSNGSAFVAGTYLFKTRYNEYDLYLQDTWKARRNLTIDAGLRWEIRMAPNNPENRILRPDVPLVAGASPTNTARWVPGNLYNNQLANLGPSIGFAWDPFGTGKTSIRSNYRIAFDRINTFLLSSTVYNNLPGQTIGVVTDAYGQSGGRLANVPKLSPPSTSPSSLTQPIPFSNSNITVVDPNYKTPTTHQWSFSMQREVLRNTVVEVSYFGRRAYHLLGAYNANQSEVLRNGFTDEFKIVQAGGQSALINRLAAADSRLQPGETPSGMIRRLYATEVRLNSVGAVAQSLGTRIQGTRSLTDLSGAGPFALMPFPQFLGGANIIDSNDFSTYHAFVVQVERRLSRGISVQGSYTLSKSLDTRSFDPTFTVVATGNATTAGSTPYDIYNRKLNYGISDFDRTHALQSNWLWELPFGRGKRFGDGAGPWLNRLIGGWQVTGWFRATSGRPFSTFAGAYTYNGIVQSFPNCNGCSRQDGAAYDDLAKGGFKWYFNDELLKKFSAPAVGELGNTGRNFFRRDGYFTLDISFNKRTAITEKINLELRADCTNFTNTPTFGNPTTVLTDATFGRIRSSVESSSRTIQLGAKINF
jgi:hypothetical protein